MEKLSVLGTCLSLKVLVTSFIQRSSGACFLQCTAHILCQTQAFSIWGCQYSISSNRKNTRRRSSARLLAESCYLCSCFLNTEYSPFPIESQFYIRHEEMKLVPSWKWNTWNGSFLSFSLTCIMFESSWKLLQLNGGCKSNSLLDGLGRK